MSDYGFTSAGTSYDDEDRLTGYARASGTFTQAWNLTPVGDWNSITTNGTAQNRTHGPTHELLTAAGQNITTDVKGNITVLPANLTPQNSPLGLQWDFDNKLKAADLGNNSSVDVNFQYDALGRRVARLGSSGSFVFVQHDQQTIADYGYGDAPSSPLYRYVYASYIDEPVVRKAAGAGGAIHYYHRNQQYSITAMTTSTGAVAERYAYTAYGQPTIASVSGTVLTSSAVGNRYTYTGREWDETLGLHHFRARWMSPLAGRFLGRDPMRYFDGYLMSQFGHGKALVDLDPYGLYTYSATELLWCYRKLQNRTYGYLAGYDCAAALLDKFLNGTPASNPFQNCPTQCSNEAIDNELPPKTCMSLSAANTSKCGQSNSHVFSIGGSHEFMRGDLFYAFRNVTWTGWADCKVTCGSLKSCYKCCSCNTSCTGRVTIFDKYDFCGTTFGDKFSLTNCGCAMERVGWGTKFKVACSKPFNRSFNALLCPGLAVPGPYDCGATRSNDPPPVLPAL
jgi:RHS repeat-associated protein